MTRAADSFAIPTTAGPSNGWFNATTGTFLSYSYGNINTAQPYYARVIGGDYPIEFAGFDGSLQTAGAWNNSTDNHVSMSLAGSTTQPVSMALAWDQNAMTETFAATTGQKNARSFSGAWSSNYMYIGAGGVSGFNVGTYSPLNTSVMRVTFFPIRMPDVFLVNTTP